MPTEPQMSPMVGQMEHHCHDKDGAVERTDCKTMYCVFCEFTIQFQAQPVTFTVSHILYLSESRVPAPPRPEQSVELQPPKYAPFA
jgi:hypothetical protein